MSTFVKIDDINVAEIGTIESKRVYTKTELLAQKARLEEDLLKVNTLLGVLAAPKVD